MKKIVSTTLLVLFSIILAAAQTGDKFEINGIHYEIKSIRIYKLHLDPYAPSEDVVCASVCPNPDSYAGKITIPENITYNGSEYKVMNIGERAFADCKDVTEIHLPESIYRIDDYAFADCGNLKMNIPHSLRFISKYVFQNTALSGAPDFSEVIYTHDFSFYGANFNSITLGHSLARLGSYTFLESTVTNVVFIDSKPDEEYLTKLYTHSFSSDKLTKLILPQKNEVEYAIEAFYACPELEEIILPEVDEFKQGSEIQFISLIEGPYCKTKCMIAKCPKLRRFVTLNPQPPKLYILNRYTREYVLDTNADILDDYSNCVLKVPAGSEDAYRADPVWGKFLSIEGFQPGEYAGINDIGSGATDTSAPEYYNLQGIRVNNPVSGQLYIRRNGSKSEKIILN